jgi:hypothetical protein
MWLRESLCPQLALRLVSWLVGWFVGLVILLVHMTYGDGTEYFETSVH